MSAFATRPATAHASSSRSAGTSIRVGASHDWPLFEKQEFAPFADRRGEVGVAENDVRRLSAKLLRDPLHGVGRGLGDQDAGAGRAGEGDHVDARVGRHRMADLGARAVDEVEDAGGRARRLDDLGEDEPAHRRDLARLQDDRAAGGKGRRDLADDLVQRPVPRRDERRDADRLLGDER